MLPLILIWLKCKITGNTKKFIVACKSIKIITKIWIHDFVEIIMYYKYQMI